MEGYCPQMHDRDIIIESLREDGIDPTPEQIGRIDADLTNLAHILLDYFIDQRRRGKKITDPYSNDNKLHECSHLLQSINKRTSRRNQSGHPTGRVFAIRSDK